MRCAEHGVQQVRVPWAEAQSRFTALFEAMVIDWLKVASFSAVARQCRLSWDQVAGIQERAVRRGLSRRPLAAAQAVGVDETSFQRRHEYVTVVNDLTTSEPRVLYVADGRTRAALDGYFAAVGEAGAGGSGWWRWTCGQPTSGPCASTRRRWSRSTGSTWRSTRGRRSTRFGGRRTGPCGNKATTGC